jgi:hypothetical protein
VSSSWPPGNVFPQPWPDKVEWLDPNYQCDTDTDCERYNDWLKQVTKPPRPPYPDEAQINRDLYASLIPPQGFAPAVIPEVLPVVVPWIIRVLPYLAPFLIPRDQPATPKPKGPLKRPPLKRPQEMPEHPSYRVPPLEIPLPVIVRPTWPQRRPLPTPRSIPQPHEIPTPRPTIALPLPRPLPMPGPAPVPVRAPRPRLPSLMPYLPLIYPLLEPRLRVTLPPQQPLRISDPGFDVGRIGPELRPPPVPLTLTQPLPLQLRPGVESCVCEQPKPRKKRKPRTECKTGTYTETRKGTIKHPRRTITCR